jgi:hypothetical protein
MSENTRAPHAAGRLRSFRLCFGKTNPTGRAILFYSLISTAEKFWQNEPNRRAGIQTTMSKLTDTLVTFGVLLLVANNGSSPSSAAAQQTTVSMHSSAWAIRYSPGMPVYPSPRENGGWYFDFPSAPGSVHYVTAAVDMAAVKSVTATIEVTATGNPTFEYALQSNNTCINPAHVRLLLQQKGDDLSGANGKQYYRWWSINAAYRLTQGSTTLTAEVSDPSQWLSVFGEKADSSPAARAGFRQAMSNLGAVGFSFGGGCFYGHGVRVTGGAARFVATDYEVR